MEVSPSVIAHDALDDAHIPVGGVFRQQKAGGVLRKEVQIKVPAFRPDDPAVEHGVDVVRPAFERPHPQSAVDQRL